jgi:hypothetical protein
MLLSGLFYLWVRCFELNARVRDRLPHCFYL